MIAYFINCCFSSSDRVLYSSKAGEKNNYSNTNLGGEKITVEDACVRSTYFDTLSMCGQELKTVCWGGPNIVPRQDWIKGGLIFHEVPRSNSRWAFTFSAHLASETLYSPRVLERPPLPRQRPFTPMVWRQWREPLSLSSWSCRPSSWSNCSLKGNSQKGLQSKIA